MRILVIGTSCAGKTTFSRRLGTILQSPVIELDELHWAENWQEKPDGQFAQLVREATSAPAWIADGNCSVVRDVLWPQATLVVWLNHRFPSVLWRGLTRSLRRGLTRESLWHGNRESLRRIFIIARFDPRLDHHHAWPPPEGVRRAARSGRYPQLEWIEFTDPGQAERWLCGLASGDRKCPDQSGNPG